MFPIVQQQRHIQYSLTSGVWDGRVVYVDLTSILVGRETVSDRPSTQEMFPMYMVKSTLVLFSSPLKSIRTDGFVWCFPSRS